MAPNERNYKEIVCVFISILFENEILKRFCKCSSFGAVAVISQSNLCIAMHVAWCVARRSVDFFPADNTSYTRSNRSRVETSKVKAHLAALTIQQPYIMDQIQPMTPPLPWQKPIKRVRQKNFSLLQQVEAENIVPFPDEAKLMRRHMIAEHLVRDTTDFLHS